MASREARDVLVGEPVPEPRVALAPDDERRASSARQPRAGGGEASGLAARCRRRIARWVPWSKTSHTASTSGLAHAACSGAPRSNIRRRYQRGIEPIVSSPSTGVRQSPEPVPREAGEQR